MQTFGKLYLIPCTLSNPGEITGNPNDVLPQSICRAIELIDCYVVENEKTARKFIKSMQPSKIQASLQIVTLNKHSDYMDEKELLKPLLEGKNMGLLSESGCPGVADPGAVVVQLAHQNGIQVIPLVGPSSILLALMASGMNGQSFTFNGYLPIEASEKKQMIKSLEKISFEKNQSQIFIETPYRNNKLLEYLVQVLHPNTFLCVACDITLPTEFIQTKPIYYWKKQKVDLHKRPCIFIIYRKI